MQQLANLLTITGCSPGIYHTPARLRFRERAVTNEDLALAYRGDGETILAIG